MEPVICRFRRSRGRPGREEVVEKVAEVALDDVEFGERHRQRVLFIQDDPPALCFGVPPPLLTGAASLPP
jgi:hypothetical protein